MLPNNKTMEQYLKDIISDEMIYITPEIRNTIIEGSIEELLHKIVDKTLDKLVENDICPKCLNKLLGYKRKLLSEELEYNQHCTNCGFQNTK